VALAAAPVNLKAGEPAPYDGALVDPPTAESIRVKRVQCEEENKRLEAALNEQPVPALDLGWKLALGGAGVAFVAGLVLGALATR
jgi:hypothetical protein